METVKNNPTPHARTPSIPKIPVTINNPKLKNHFFVPRLKLILTISISVKCVLFEKTIAKNCKGTKA